jgi:hypothetical protein
MAVQINEVVIRASITGNECNTADRDKTDAQNATAIGSSQVSSEDVLELIDEVLTTKKER